MLDHFLENISTDLVIPQTHVLNNITSKRNNMVILPRGGGKTLLLTLAALFNSKYSYKQHICITAPVYLQTKRVFGEMGKWYKEADIKLGSTFCRAVFNNHSMVLGLPIANISNYLTNISNYTFDHIFIDEYQALPKKFRDYIDSDNVQSDITIMINNDIEDIEDEKMLDLITNRNKCYNITKYSKSDYPKGYYA